MNKMKMIKNSRGGGYQNLVNLDFLFTLPYERLGK